MQPPNGNGRNPQIAWDYVHQANILSDKATEKTGEEADNLYQQAYEKYAAALEVDPREFDALYNWGIALADQARTKSGEEADKLFEEAFAKYQAALFIEPQDYEVLHNWGVALIDQGQLKGGEDAENLYAQAEERLKEANSFGSDYSAYVLASLAAMRGKEDECKEWLTAALESGDLAEIVDKETMEEDPAFENVKGCDWFKDILNKL